MVRIARRADQTECSICVDSKGWTKFLKVRTGTGNKVVHYLHVLKVANVDWGQRKFTDARTARRAGHLTKLFDTLAK